MTGDRLKNLGCAVCILFPPALMLYWLIPQFTWDKWAERYF